MFLLPTRPVLVASFLSPQGFYQVHLSHLSERWCLHRHRAPQLVFEPRKVASKFTHTPGWINSVWQKFQTGLALQLDWCVCARAGVRCACVSVCRSWNLSGFHLTSLFQSCETQEIIWATRHECLFTVIYLPLLSPCFPFFACHRNRSVLIKFAKGVYIYFCVAF